MASPQWPAPTITVVVLGTAAPPLFTRAGSADLDGDVRRVGDDVVDRGALLRLRDQRPDLLGGGVGVDLVTDVDAAEAVADIRVGAEDPVQVHLRGAGGPARPLLDPPPPGDGRRCSGPA